MLSTDNHLHIQQSNEHLRTYSCRGLSNIRSGALKLEQTIIYCDLRAETKCRLVCQQLGVFTMMGRTFCGLKYYF